MWEETGPFGRVMGYIMVVAVFAGITVYGVMLFTR